MATASPSVWPKVSPAFGPGPSGANHSPTEQKRERWIDALSTMEGVESDPGVMERAWEALEGAGSDGAGVGGPGSDARDDEMIRRIFSHLRFFRRLARIAGRKAQRAPVSGA